MHEGGGGEGEGEEDGGGGGDNGDGCAADRSQQWKPSHPTDPDPHCQGEAAKPSLQQEP